MYTHTRQREVARPLAIAIILAFIAGLIGFSTPHASAAINPDIKITDTELALVNAQERDANGNLVPNTGLNVGEEAIFSWTWDATSADVQPGDSFVIQLPEEFENVSTLSVPLLSDEYGQVGTCERTAGPGSTVTCTFNDTVLGKTGIQGTGKATIAAAQTTTSTESEFIINDTPTMVPLPGNEPIKEKVVVNWNYIPRDFDKESGPVKEGSTAIQWNLWFGTDAILDGLGYADGVNPTGDVEFTFVDTLGEGLQFPEDDFLIESVNARAIHVTGLISSKSAANPTQSDVIVARLNPAWTPPAEAAARGDFKIEATYNADRTEATYTISGPFKRGQNYQFFYYTTPSTGEEFNTNYLYENNIRAEGTPLSSDATMIVRSSLAVEAILEEGFGTFAIQKMYVGSEAGEVSDDTKVDVSVAWELPDGKTAADFPGWTAPDNPFTVTAGTTEVLAGETFPKGTILTLTEVADSAAPALPRGIAFTEANFVMNPGTDQVEQGATGTVTVENTTTAHVQLQNTVEAQEGSFSVAKALTGVVGVDLTDADFTFDYVCTDPAGAELTGSLTVKGDGVAVPAAETFRVGTECVISEDVANATTPAQHTLIAPESQTITVVADTTVEATFTNAYTFTPGVTDVTGEKVWVGGTDYPAVDLQLFQSVSGGEPIPFGDPVTVSADNEWSYTWTDVPAESDEGVAFVYTVDEVTVPANYEKTADGMTVTNTFVPPAEEPTEEPTTEVPTEEPTTEVPTEEPTTEVPTEEPTTEVPTEEPTTEEPTTEVPTEEPTTEEPTEEPTTEVPTEEPTTEVPTEEPTTEVPTEEPTDVPVGGTPPPAVPEAPHSPGNSLPFTGANTTSLAIAGLLLLGAGSVLVARRQHA